MTSLTGGLNTQEMSLCTLLDTLTSMEISFSTKAQAGVTPPLTTSLLTRLSGCVFCHGLAPLKDLQLSSTLIRNLGLEKLLIIVSQLLLQT